MQKNARSEENEAEGPGFKAANSQGPGQHAIVHGSLSTARGHSLQRDKAVRVFFWVSTTPDGAAGLRATAKLSALKVLLDQARQVGNKFMSVKSNSAKSGTRQSPHNSVAVQRKALDHVRWSIRMPCDGRTF